mgnify:FL=1
MQTNIICDAHGYYIIDMLDAAKNNKIPIPSSVSKVMKEFRKRPFLKEHAFSEDGLEYFHSTLIQWKRLINLELSQLLKKQFGITIRYYTYTEEPPIITIDRDSIDP